MKRYLIVLMVLYLLMYGIVSALEITTTWNDDTYPNDWYSFDTIKNTNIQVWLVDKLSQEYNNWKRIKIYQNYDPGNNWNGSYINVWTWVLRSQLYWDFYLRYGDIELLNDNIVNSNCSDVSYSFSWKLYSPWFWELNIGSNSYYCPKTTKSQINLSSNLL